MGKFAITRPVSVLMLTLFCVALGVAAYRALTRDLLPNIYQPALQITTHYAGAASQDIEEQVTRKLEEQLGGVKGMWHMSSFSGDEKSVVVLDFHFGTDLNFASIEVREKLDQIEYLLPGDADKPVIERLNPGVQPLLVANLFSEDVETNAWLRHFAEANFMVQLERIPGVASVSLAGGSQYEVALEIDRDKLRAYRLSLQDVEAALRREQVNIRGGRLVQGKNEFLLRTIGKASRLEEIANTVVTRSPSTVYLRDVIAYRLDAQGKVDRDSAGNPRLCLRLAAKTQESLSRVRVQAGKQIFASVQLAIYKKPGTNAVEVADRVRAVLAGCLAEERHQRLQLAITYDQSLYIRDALANIADSAWQGIVLSALVLLVFLGNLRTTLIIALAMPVSVIAAFALFPVAGLGLNLFSMAGLTLAVGMVVDNAIVVIEAAFVHRSHERRIDKAITNALTEIAPPVFSSTLTTLAVFVPILFIHGTLGQVFGDLSYPVIFSLGFSLLVAFTLIPMLLYRLLGATSPFFDAVDRLCQRAMYWLFGWCGRLFVRCYTGCMRVLLASMSLRLCLLVGVVALFLLSLRMVPPSELLPATPEPNLGVEASLAPGTNLAESDRLAGKIEQLLSTDERLAADIAHFTARVTAGEIEFRIGLGNAQSCPAVMARLRQQLARIPDLGDVRVTAVSPLKSLFSSEQSNLKIVVSGLETARIAALCREAIARIGAHPQLASALTDIRSSLGEGKPELWVTIHKDQAADHYLSAEDVAQSVEIAVSGRKVTSFELADAAGVRQLDIRLALFSSSLDKARLESLPLKNSLGQTVALKTVAGIDEAQGPAMIQREERTRVGVVSANLSQTASLGEVMAWLTNAGQSGVLDSLPMPAGYRADLKGESETLRQSSASLWFALCAGIILVYMVMASQFESLLHPFVIMFTIPLSVTGAFFCLRLAGSNLSVPALIGLIMLAGIVVNNGILLIDYMNILRARGHDRNDAIVQAGQTRMRPIFITTLTTVLGMLPIALGQGFGASLYQPLAIVVSGGLTFATLLTLVFIPVAYCLFDDIKEVAKFVWFRIYMWRAQ